MMAKAFAIQPTSIQSVVGLEQLSRLFDNVTHKQVEQTLQILSQPAAKR
jgi:hypothetical protein